MPLTSPVRLAPRSEKARMVATNPKNGECHGQTTSAIQPKHQRGHDRASRSHHTKIERKLCDDGRQTERIRHRYSTVKLKVPFSA